MRILSDKTYNKTIIKHRTVTLSGQFDGSNNDIHHSYKGQKSNNKYKLNQSEMLDIN